jgi:uncharacterized membrane protein
MSLRTTLLLPTILSIILFGGLPAETQAQPTTCAFMLGFRTLRDLMPEVVGDCVEDEWYDQDRRETRQQTMHTRAPAVDQRTTRLWSPEASLSSGAAAGVGLLALPFVLVLPGLAVTVMLYPSGTLGVPERLTLTLGLSLAIVAISGLLLNVTPWGLQPASWAVALGGTTLVAGAAAFARARRETHQARGARLKTALQSARAQLGARQVALLVLAVVTAVGALALARDGAVRHPSPGFTQLWMLPDETGARDTIRLGVRNAESTVATYQLRVQTGTGVLQEWPSIDLQPGEVWQASLTVPDERTGGQAIEALLARADDPTSVYRRATLWRDGQAG